MKRNEAKKWIEELRIENEQWLSDTKKVSMDGIFSIIERVRVEKKKDFILELIQNADDCNSTEISFDLTPSKIIIQNNGDPFRSDPDSTKDNIFAICKLGRTTKESGKIGFMGFGFRAVFEVSKKPEIYSDNFSFYFDEDMIVPHWIENIPKNIKTRLDRMKGRGSVFVLPNLGKEIQRDVKQALINLSPALLLYLQTLKRIKAGQEILQMEPGPFPNSFWVSINGKERHLWKRYYSVRLPIPKELRGFLWKDRNLDQIGKQPKEYEQISITFEVLPDGKISDKQDSGLFAFLPLADEKNTKFGFNIQGDFSVDAGRRRLREPNGDWNQWILANVHRLIPDILEDYKSQSSLRTEFYKILPLDDPERPRYLNIVKKGVDEYIQRANSILVKVRKSKKHPDGKKWVKPKHAVVADSELQKLFDNTDLRHLFGTNKLCIADDEIDFEGMKYIKEIVDDEFSFDEVIKILKESRWIFDRKLKNRKNPEKWVGDLILYLASELEKRIEGKSWWESHNERKNLIDKLKDVKFILTDNLKIIKPQRIFLPPSEDIDIPSHLRKKYNIVSRKLVWYIEAKRIKNEIEKERRQEGLRLLQELVPKLTPEIIVKEIINPAFYGDNWKKYSDSTLGKYIDFVRRNKECWEKAQIKLKVKTKGKKRNYKSPKELFLPRSYGNEFDLDNLYRGFDYDNFVSLDYIKRFLKSKSDKRREHIKSWKNFLMTIGVIDFPQIRNIEEQKWKEDIENELKVYHPQNEVKDSNWGYQKINFDFCPSLRDIINHCVNDKIENPCRRLKVVLKFTDRKWPYYKSFLKSKYTYHTLGAHGRSEEKLGESSFSRLLKESNWIPTKDGKHLKPEAVALGELQGIVEAPIIDYKIGNAEFKKYLQDLGLQTKPTVEGAIAVLKARVEQKESKINRFVEIYEYLAQHQKDKKKIREELKDFHCIFLSKGKRKYWKISEAFWEGGDAFLEWKINITQTYPRLRDFFIGVLGVKEKPAHEDYLEFLCSYLWRKEKLNNREKSSLGNVYHHLNYIITTPELRNSGSWASLKERFKIYCENEYWAEVGEERYYNDNDDIYKLFKKNKDIVFAYIPKDVDVKRLFAELGVGSLPENYVESCSVSGVQIVAKEALQNEIRRISKYIAHFLKEKFPKTFDRLNKEGAFSRLSETIVKFVAKIAVEASVGSFTVSLGERKSFYSWISSDNCLYLESGLQANDASCFRHIGIALSNAFQRGAGLEILVPYIMGKDEAEIKQALQDYGIFAAEEPKIEKPEVERAGLVEEKPAAVEEFEVFGMEELKPEKIDKHIEAAIESFQGPEKKADKKIRIFRKKRKIAHIKKKGSVRVTPEILPSAEKDLVEREIDGESLLLPPNEDPKILGLNGMLIKQTRNKLCKIVEAIGGNPETVNLCWADESIDGFIESEQLVFNLKVIQNKPLIFWIVLVAREMAYLEHGHMIGRYALVKTMRSYIVDAHEKLCKKVQPTNNR